MVYIDITPQQFHVILLMVYIDITPQQAQAHVILLIIDTKTSSYDLIDCI